MISLSQRITITKQHHDDDADANDNDDDQINKLGIIFLIWNPKVNFIKLYSTTKCFLSFWLNQFKKLLFFYLAYYQN